MSSRVKKTIFFTHNPPQGLFWCHCLYFYCDIVGLFLAALSPTSPPASLFPLLTLLPAASPSPLSLLCCSAARSLVDGGGDVTGMASGCLLFWRRATGVRVDRRFTPPPLSLFLRLSLLRQVENNNRAVGHVTRRHVEQVPSKYDTFITLRSHCLLNSETATGLTLCVSL